MNTTPRGTRNKPHTNHDDRNPVTPALTLAAHNIHDPATPITTHIAALLNAARGCHTTTDNLGNCATCPLPAAAEALAVYINSGFEGATR